MRKNNLQFCHHKKCNFFSLLRSLGHNFYIENSKCKQIDVYPNNTSGRSNKNIVVSILIKPRKCISLQRPPINLTSASLYSISLGNSLVMLNLIPPFGILVLYITAKTFFMIFQKNIDIKTFLENQICPPKSLLTLLPWIHNFVRK